ncbi:hypothetical protein Esi_0823_0001 [Ectocarpus siliculosus]|uniref:Uncharacterized protein n=1 Tax=Ectocarpus siliculosus TaxID=2880 RepID=D7G7F0_ECTSI|nr:hypothetical protein Esi_0823_0001 [Ectocarpus siliculosus]|eukprot:CBJ33991.1 hypothetical protein Esi_0823_0001 [Ectocarpus siliculosus]
MKTMAAGTMGIVPIVLLALSGTLASAGSAFSGSSAHNEGNVELLADNGTININLRSLQAEVETCDGGIVGIQQSDICCSSSCGSCGGTGCTSRDGGSEACCGGGVRASGRFCSVYGRSSLHDRPGPYAGTYAGPDAPPYR